MVDTNKVIDTLPTTTKNKQLGENKPLNDKSDLIKWIAIGLLCVAGIVGSFFLAGLGVNESKWYQTILWLGVIGMGTVLASFTTTGVQLLQFFKDARLEIRKVVWPTKQEAMQAVLMVIVAVAVMSVLLWVIDMVIFRIIRFLTT